MSPGERLWQDSQRILRRQRRLASIERISKYMVPGGPRPELNLRGDAGMLRWAAGGGGPALAQSVAGELRVPQEVAAMQQGPLRPGGTHFNASCCHCVGAARVGGSPSSMPKGSLSRGGPPTFTYGGLGIDRSGFIFDIHAHLFAPTAWDFYITYYIATTFGVLDTALATGERIDWVKTDLGDAGVRRAAVSGFSDKTAEPTLWDATDYLLGDDPADAQSLDYMVILAATAYPSFFVPFMNGFSLRRPEDIEKFVTDQLAIWGKWRGVGEIIVHGHENDQSETVDTENLVFVLQSATDYVRDDGLVGIPVQLHWDIGDVDDGYDSAEDNYTQLKEILDGVPGARVIIAHCGLGPWDAFDTSTDLSAWKDRVEELLARTDVDVYFDLGGMQIVGVEVDSGGDLTNVLQLMNVDNTIPTDVGTFLLEQMVLYPDRFMLGTDVETRNFTEWTDATPDPSPDGKHHYGIEQYVSSIANYLAFLDYGVATISGFTSDIKWQVQYLNAWDLLAP